MTKEEVEKALQEFAENKSEPVANIVGNLMKLMLGENASFILIGLLNDQHPLVITALHPPQVKRHLEKILMVLDKIQEEPPTEEKPH